MHMSYPARKNSHPGGLRPRHSILPSARRGRQRGLVIFGVGIFFLLLLVGGIALGGNGTELDAEPAGTPAIVVVTMLEPGSLSKDYIESVQENRLRYAARHGMSECVRDLKPKVYAPATAAAADNKHHHHFPGQATVPSLQRRAITISTALLHHGRRLQQCAMRSPRTPTAAMSGISTKTPSLWTQPCRWWTTSWPPTDSRH